MYNNKFIITNDEYYGDFDLKLTLESGQTSQPPWICVRNKYYEVLVIEGIQVLVEMEQKSLNNDLIVNYYSYEEVNEKELIRELFYIFDLNYNIEDVYEFLSDSEELREVYQFNKGLRIFNAHNPYECIISSICSANNSIKRWTKSITDIRREYGKKFRFKSRNYHMFPAEEHFLRISDNDLKLTGVGYRSTQMLNSTKIILSEKDYHKSIMESSYSDAFNKLNELEGVGPKVADCILLYGYNRHEAYPVDVWINRITTHLYFKNYIPNNREIKEFGMHRFGDYAGYVQLYLFNYARMSGLMDKLNLNNKE